MRPFTITERVTSNRILNCFIPDPNDNSGGGWSYKATSDGEQVTVEYIGSVRLKHLPTLVSLLDIAIKEDNNRAEEYDSITFDFLSYESPEHFEEGLEEFNTPVVGMNANDFWICSGPSVDRVQKSITTLTLLRASNRYIAMEYGHPMMSFDFHELEAVTALLKRFLTQD